DILAGLAHGETDSAEVEKSEEKDEKSRRRQAAKRCPDGMAGSQQESTKKSAELQAELPAQGMPTWVIATAAGALVLLAILAGLLVLRKIGTLSLIDWNPTPQSWWEIQISMDRQPQVSHRPVGSRRRLSFAASNEPLATNHFT